MDSREFQQIFEKILPEAYRLARGILDNPEDARDAVQDAFMKVFEVHGSFRGEAKLSTWIFRIVVNTCLTRLHRSDKVRARQAPLEAAENEQDHSLELWELPSVKSEIDQVRDFIAKIPRRQAAAITFYYFHNHDRRKIARAMSISTGAVSALLDRGRGHLHTLIMEKRKEEKPK